MGESKRMIRSKTITHANHYDSARFALYPSLVLMDRSSQRLHAYVQGERMGRAIQTNAHGLLHQSHFGGSRHLKHRSRGAATRSIRASGRSSGPGSMLDSIDNPLSDRSNRVVSELDDGEWPTAPASRSLARFNNKQRLGVPKAPWDGIRPRILIWTLTARLGTGTIAWWLATHGIDRRGCWPRNSVAASGP